MPQAAPPTINHQLNTINFPNSSPNFHKAGTRLSPFIPTMSDRSFAFANCRYASCHHERFRHAQLAQLGSGRRWDRVALLPALRVRAAIPSAGRPASAAPCGHRADARPLGHRLAHRHPAGKPPRMVLHCLPDPLLRGMARRTPVGLWKHAASSPDATDVRPPACALSQTAAHRGFGGGRFERFGLPRIGRLRPFAFPAAPRFPGGRDMSDDPARRPKTQGEKGQQEMQVVAWRTAAHNTFRSALPAHTDSVVISKHDAGTCLNHVATA